MCGVYAIFNNSGFVDQADVLHLANSAQIRGVDSAGLVYMSKAGDIEVIKRDFGSVKLVKENSRFDHSKFIAGHSRLVTNDVASNQPVILDDLILIHNGIITNYQDVWKSINQIPETELDSEVIPALYKHFKQKGLNNHFR